MEVRACPPMPSAAIIGIGVGIGIGIESIVVTFGRLGYAERKPHIENALNRLDPDSEPDTEAQIFPCRGEPMCSPIRFYLRSWENEYTRSSCMIARLKQFLSTDFIHR